MMKIIIIAAAVLIILFALVGRASRRGEHPREGADGENNAGGTDSSGDGNGDGGGD
jgi:hypothetical protein